MKIARRRYNAHKKSAEKRGIEFTLTFDEWCAIWEQSGKWELRGCRRGQYAMSRFGDIGPYALGNVFIQLHSQNVRDAQLGKKKPSQDIEKRRLSATGKTRTAESREKMRMAQLGKKRAPFSPEHREKLRQASKIREANKRKEKEAV